MSRRCGVLGDPITHSLSPVLHRAGYAALGLDEWEYDAHQVPAGGLASYLAGLGPDWRGLSLTMPLKREAVSLVADLSDRARLAGAVNTLLLEEGGPVGDNTDIPGAEAAIRERYDAPLTEAVILGGGATATSIGIALAQTGVSTLRLAVRDPARADETVATLRSLPGGPEVIVQSLDGEPWRADIVVSTIPAVAQTAELVERCMDVPVVFDVTYDPWPTPLASSVHEGVQDGARDRVLVSGLDLLVHQAAIQFELFTGRPAPLAAMRSAGETALDARGTP